MAGKQTLAQEQKLTQRLSPLQLLLFVLGGVVANEPW